MWCRWGRTITAVAFGITTSLASYEFSSVAQVRTPAQNPSRTVAPTRSSVTQVQSYTPSEIRAALRGLGYNVPKQGINLTDRVTRNAIRAFQQSYKLSVIDGIAGPNTQAVMAVLVRNLNRNLNLVLKPSQPLPSSQYYTNETATAVEQFQKQINFPVTGIATVSIRSRLDQEAKRILGGSTSPTPTATPTTTPSSIPTATPTASPSPTPTATPTASPSSIPTATPTTTPSSIPTATPTTTPSSIPTATPTPSPEISPSVLPTIPEISPSPTPTTSP